MTRNPHHIRNSLLAKRSAHQAPLSLGILQARILEWVAMPSSRGPSPPRDQTQVSCTAGTFFTVWATREAYTLTLFTMFSGLGQVTELTFCVYKIGDNGGGYTTAKGSSTFKTLKVPGAYKCCFQVDNWVFWCCHILEIWKVMNNNISFFLVSFIKVWFVQFSHSVLSDSLLPF